MQFCPCLLQDIGPSGPLPKKRETETDREKDEDVSHQLSTKPKETNYISDTQTGRKAVWKKR